MLGGAAAGYDARMPNTEPNPNKIDRQHTDDSPPPADHGERLSPDDDAGAVELGHEEAEAKRQRGDAVPATQGTGAGGGEPSPPRTSA